MLDAIEISSEGKLITVFITGRLGTDFYTQFESVVGARVAEFRKVRVLLVVEDFLGRSFAGFQEELKFDFEHRHDIERLAVVGETDKDGSITRFLQWLTSTNIRHFDAAHLADARAWIQET